jgi:predicted membrane-bound mannosyltransferase
VDDLARLDPRHAALPVQVIAPADNYWPLPWYFRALNQAGYWSEIPGTAAPVVIASVRLEPKFNAPDHIAAGIFELRPGAFVELFVETNLWNALLRANDDSKK